VTDSILHGRTRIEVVRRRYSPKDLDHLFTTEAFLASQFEGFVLDTTAPVERNGHAERPLAGESLCGRRDERLSRAEQNEVRHEVRTVDSMLTDWKSLEGQRNHVQARIEEHAGIAEELELEPVDVRQTR